MLKKIVLAVIALILVCIFAATLTLYRYYYIMSFGDRCNEPDLRVYRLDFKRRLVFGPGLALLINTEERVVLSLPVLGRRFGGVAIWPRDRIQGVILGDGVKGDIRDNYHFGIDIVDIQYANSTGNHVLHIAL